MILRDYAHGRAGDKGTIVNCSVVAYDPNDFAWLCNVVTVDRVRAHLGALVHGEVRRYLVPNLTAMNFVFSRPPGHGVTRTLALDAHGKSLSSALLELPVPPRHGKEE